MKLQTFDTTCLQNDLIAHDVYEIKFEKPKDFQFKTGQYVMWNVPLVDNPEDIQGRAYSIASTPEEEELLFVVRLKEGGRASTYIKEKLEPGTKLSFMGPLGIFGLQEQDGIEHILVATSSGVAPFRAYLQHAVEQGIDQRIDLIYGVRHEEDLFWQQELADIASKLDNLHVHIVLSQPDDAWEGLTGHVQDHIPSITDDFSAKHVYICGNPNMVQEVKGLCLEQWGMEKAQVHMEEYV